MAKLDDDIVARLGAADEGIEESLVAERSSTFPTNRIIDNGDS